MEETLLDGLVSAPVNHCAHHNPQTRLPQHIHCVVDRVKWFCHSFRDVDDLDVFRLGAGRGSLSRLGLGCAWPGRRRAFQLGSVFHAGSASSRIKPCSGVQARSMSLRRRSGFARPYIAALSCLMRFTVPSTAPELYSRVSPATTASRSRAARR